MKKYIALLICLAMLLPLLAGCSKEIAVTADTFTGVTFQGEAVGKTKTDYVATLKPEALFQLTREDISVLSDGKEVTGFAYDPATGTLTVPGKLITGDLSIHARAKHVQVNVDVSGAADITVEADKTAAALEAFTATLLCEKEHMMLDIPSVSVSVGGKPLEDGWAFDFVTGKLTVEAAKVTGDIAITAKTVESIVGVWETVLPLTDMINKEMEKAGLGDVLKFQDMDIAMVFTFREDGSGGFALADGAAEAWMDSFQTQLSDAVYDLLELVLQQSNLDMTVEEYLSASGLTVDELIADAMGENLSMDMLEELRVDCYYTAQDGMLFLYGEQGTEYDPDGACPYTVRDGVLTLQKPEEVNDELLAEDFFPLVLKRQATK